MAATVWKGYLSFGLVTFPVRLFSAARARTVHFHMLHKKDLSRVKEVWYCAEEDKPIGRSEIVKGFEASKEEYVVVDDKELEAIAPPTASTIEVAQFVSGDEVDPVYLEMSYYMTPEEKVGKAYDLFAAALRESGRYAVAKMAMHNREHVVLIRPSKQGLLLHTLFYADELNLANRGQHAAAKFTAKELDLAKSLINQMSGPFKPDEFHDAYRENVEHLIDQKKKGHAVPKVKVPRKAPVVDLMEALKRSLKAQAAQPAKKPSKRRRAA
jgi:DNA end-binding protein Ku